jgi:acyl-CoA synthetase (AMP-forming)/AMP-acid ligase II
MQTERFQPNPQYLATLRIGVTIVALLLLAGSMLLVWLIDDRDAALIVTLAATLVGWVVTLILAKPSAQSPTQITNLDDDNSPSRWLY